MPLHFLVLRHHFSFYTVLPGHFRNPLRVNLCPVTFTLPLTFPHSYLPLHFSYVSSFYGTLCATVVRTYVVFRCVPSRYVTSHTSRKRMLASPTPSPIFHPYPHCSPSAFAYYPSGEIVHYYCYKDPTLPSDKDQCASPVPDTRWYRRL